MITIDLLTLDIFKADNFLHVCNICRVTSDANMWNYENIDESIMYDSHGGWVYVIASNNIVKKIGETGLPLGIRPKRGAQPIGGTKARLARYRTHKDEHREDTDHCIRKSLESNISAGETVSIWARKCVNPDSDVLIFGELCKIATQFHKIVEKIYLKTISEEFGELPPLNKLTG
jgi:hypothetical protein